LFKKNIVVINVKNTSTNQMGANDRPLTETNFRKYVHKSTVYSQYKENQREQRNCMRRRL